ncbi:MAG: 16S rRNA (cytidine(1402)-2'-O)-methyltransferase, partial [Pseudomonadota bacterium]
MAVDPGTLYVVATPIGNLGDVTVRASEILGEVDQVWAEDTRHSRKLLQHLSVSTTLVAYHDHNENEQAQKAVALLNEGTSIALISDAGTPLISDPGYRLVSACLAAGHVVRPVPGASAVIAALSVSGMPTDRFTFEGFLPAKSAARDERLTHLATETRTLVFYESSHRIRSSVSAMS